MTETKDKMNKKKIAVISVLVVLAVAVIALLTVYTSKVNFYKLHFLPYTTVNGMNCSELDVETVASMLNEQVKEYSLTIYGRDEDGVRTELGTISAADIGLKLEDSVAQTEEVLSQQDPTRFLYAGEKEQYSYQVVPVITFDEELLADKLSLMDAFTEEKMIFPQDAYLSGYNEEIGKYEIVPEIIGTKLVTEQAMACISAGIIGGAESVDLTEQNCYQNPEVLSDNTVLNQKADTLNKWLGAEITYDWNTNQVVVDKDLIKDWIVETEDAFALDEDAIADFVAEKASKYDTYGKTRQFTTTLGVTLTLGTGGFGWRTDREAVTEKLIAMIEEGKVTKAEPVYSNTAPWRGSNDIGNSYVEIDLTNQHLYLYYGGALVFESDFVSGNMSSTPDCVSPAGVFDITYKTTNAILRGGDYAELVSYWMPFFGNYGMHDAQWRTEFGGDIFLENGSHGCINLPLDSAATIYNYVREGFPVICYYY